jgi:ABC-type nitrate/sulfonate/bicarbonate transport system substrate-binding protein
VTIIQSGQAATRLVALTSRALDATVLAYPELGEATRLGMNILAHMRDMKTAAFPMNAIVVRRAFLEKNRDVVKRFQQAYAEGTHQLLISRDKALPMLAQRMQQKNPKAVEETYQYVAPSFSFPTRISHQGIRNTLEMVAQKATGGKADSSMEKYLDETTLDELDKEGFFKKFGK